MLTREDWNEYAGPNEYFAATGDRILHREIPEQEAEFWADFMAGQNGGGFAKIDCGHNRELLLQKYAQKYGNDALVVRSELNSLWRKYAISYSVFEAGFIDPNPQEEVVERPLTKAELKGRQWEEWARWCNSPETKTKDILEKRRTDREFAEFYSHQSVAERAAVSDGSVNLNARQTPPSTVTSQRVASDEVRQFAQDYLRLPTSEIRKMLSPGINPQGPEAAKRAQYLFDQAVLFGLL